MDVTLLTRICIVVSTLLDIVPGFIHFLAEDGGAGSIAGIVMNWDNATTIEVEDKVWKTSDYHKDTVLVMFCALGLIQIKMGVLTMLMALWLPQCDLLYLLTIILIVFQMFKVIVDLFGYRHIHSIAPYAPGGYKPYVVLVFYTVATISQVIWFRKQKKYCSVQS